MSEWLNRNCWSEGRMFETDIIKEMWLLMRTDLGLGSDIRERGLRQGGG